MRSLDETYNKLGNGLGKEVCMVVELNILMLTI